MKLEEIKKNWQRKAFDTNASRDVWDNMAPLFASKALPDSKSNLTMKIIEENKMVKTGDRVLDVGCGGGRFSFALEKMGASVLGIDFSPKMIEECLKAKDDLASRAEFKVCDWENTDLSEMCRVGKFDLVLANMTPAISSADTFLKLSQASKNWCIYVKHTRRTRSIFDELNSHMGFSQDDTVDDGLVYSMLLLWQMGFKPKVDYNDEEFVKEVSLESITKDYTLRMKVSHDLSSQDETKIAEFLKSKSHDGKVTEITKTTIAAIYWQV